MIRQLGSIATRVFEKTCPDPFVIAIILALLTAGLAFAFGDVTPSSAIEAWRADAGVWRFLAFGMQMCLVLVTGHALAATRPVRRIIAKLADWPRSQGQAAALVGAVATLTGVINWGLSLIVGALVAREVGRATYRRGMRIHYPLLAAAGFLGLMVWHGGLSGSAPLSMTSKAGAAKVLPPQYVEQLGPGGIPLSQTIFAPMNLYVTGGLLITIPIVLLFIGPKRPEEIRTFEHYLPLGRADDVAAAFASNSTPRRASGGVPDWLDRSPWVAWLGALPFLVAVARFVWVTGTSAVGAEASPVWIVLSGLNKFGLNEINASMLAAGLILHGSARSYMAAVEDGARGCGGIIIQFPIYGGIVALVEGAGLIPKIAGGFNAIGNPHTLPLLTCAAASVINFFIPSGGAQWGVQGPIALETALRAGVTDIGKMIMSVAYGDQLTNMLQPFWALPLLSITRVEAREIIGYTSAMMLFAAAWIFSGLLLF